MSKEDYKVKIVDQKKITGGAKIEIALVEKESGEVLDTTRIGLEDWQLKDDKFDQRISNVGARMVEDYESENVDVSGKELEL